MNDSLRSSLRNFSSLKKQILVNGAVLLAFLASGSALGFIAILLPQIEAKNATFTADIDVEAETLSWLASTQFISQIPTQILAAYLMQAKGRRLCFITFCTPMILGWFLFYFTSTGIGLIIAEALQGLSYGGMLPPGISALTEFSTPKYRGVFLVAMNAMFYMGIWFSNILGTFLHWRTVALILSIPIIIALAISLVWPESPLWLAHNGKFEQCRESFYWLRGHDSAAEKELEIFIEVQVERKRQKDLKRSKLSSKTMIRRFMNKTFQRNFYKPVFLLIGLASLMQTSGKLTLTCFPIMIVDGMTKMKSMSYIAMNVFDGVTFFGVVISSCLTKLFNRRVILFWCTCISSVSLLLSCVYVLFMNVGLVPSPSVVPLIPLLCFVIASSLGASTLPLTIGCELIPSSNKGFFLCFIAIYGALMQTITIKLSNIFFVLINVEGTLLVHVLSTIVFMVCLFKYLPETKDRTLQEIEDYYENNCFVDRIKHFERNKSLIEKN